MATLSSIDVSSYIAGLPSRKKIAVGIVLGILIVLGYWHFFLRASWNARNQAQAELLPLRAEAERTRRIASQRPLLEREIKLLEAHLSQALLQLPGEKEIPSLLTRVARLGQETDLDLALFKPGNPVAKEFYMEVPVQLKVVGMYHNLGMLFERLGRLDRIVNVADLTIRPAGKDQKAGASIQAEFGVITYTYTGSRGAKSSEPAKTPS